MIMKAEEKQRRELKKILDMELVILMDEVRYEEGIEGLYMEQWRSLVWLLQAKIQDVQRQIYLREVIMKAEEKQRPELKKIHDMELAILMDEISGKTADDPIHIDENKGYLSLLDGSQNSDDEYEGVDIELKL
ncbi:hypothetical protein LINGRAHAP2_LOCUS14179 [Linum grandiflorum]